MRTYLPLWGEKGGGFRGAPPVLAPVVVRTRTSPPLNGPPEARPPLARRSFINVRLKSLKLLLTQVFYPEPSSYIRPQGPDSASLAPPRRNSGLAPRSAWWRRRALNPRRKHCAPRVG